MAPTYDYTCTACGHKWEDFQKMSDKPKRKCPNCKKLKAKRLIGSGGGVIFKGGGFYCNDYKNYCRGDFRKRRAEKRESALKNSNPLD